MSIFKACDIRGKYGVDLTTWHADRLGAAIGRLKGPADVLVAGDGRISTPTLKSALVKALVEAGCRVTDLGTAPTPLFYFARRALGIETGVIVTASHNPAGDNGFKITLGSLPITEEEIGLLAQMIEGSEDPSPSTSISGTCTSANLLPDYIAFLGGCAPDLRGMRVVIDCAGGMAGLAARQIWACTGAQAVFLLEDVDGHFLGHAPNPAEARNLVLLQEAVRRQGADLGVAYDGDADRVAFVDESGTPVTSDQAIVLFARDALKHGPETVIFDQKCSRVVSETVRALGGQPVMELSGHTYIKRSFMTHKAAYAGELSGHHFFRSIGGDDGIAASLFFAHLLKDSGQPLSQLAATVPAYPITPDIRLPIDPTAIPAVLARLETAFQGKADIQHTDGLRLEFADGWGLVRPSVTEPVLTLRFEGSSSQALERILRQVAGAAPELDGVTQFIP